MPDTKKIYKDAAIQVRNLRTAMHEAKDRVNTDNEKHGEYTGTTYIYIRANEDDDGTRPVTGGSCLSPDLNVIPGGASGDVLEETKIEAGRQYRIECTVRNLGDLDIPFATVDFFLVTPALGFRVSAAQPIAITTVSIPGQGSSKVLVDWVASSEDAGHRCLFARACSLSPVDLPADFDTLDARNDRHIAQQNLTVLEDGDSLDFQVFPFGDKQRDLIRFKIMIRPVNKLPMYILAHPALKNLKLKTSRKIPKFEIKPLRNLLRKGAKVTIKKKSNTDYWKGTLTKADFGHFNLEMPSLRLKKQEAKAFEVVKIDTSTKKETGSILVLIKGK